MSKVTFSIEDEETTGFFALIGKVITIFSLNYIYTGKLVEINADCVLLEAPSIVYETGELTEKSWKDAQPLPNVLYIQMNCIESFGIVK